MTKVPFRLLILLLSLGFFLGAGSFAPADAEDGAPQPVLHSSVPVPAAVPTVQTQTWQAPAAPAAVESASSSVDYVLDVGDKLRIVVFGEEDMSGEFEISSTGAVALPLVGEVQAARKTIKGLQADVVRLLSQGYLKDPRVSIEVLNYRPFFILGEVVNPGSYNYVNGMTVINAIALAGGFTYRADKKDIEMKRGGKDSSYRHVSEETPVLPGDVIRIPERFF